MKLVRLRVDGFGPLQGEWTFAPDRVNVVIDDNERGKTSLFAAVAAALYGLDGDRRSNRVLTPLERWRPWAGGAYRIVLDVESAAGRHTIARDFDRGTVSVFDQGGNEVTASFLEGRDEYPVGKKLLGLDLAEFEKCALLAQGELAEVVPTDDRTRRVSTLKARLENAADTHLGDTNASEALRVLEEALRRYNAPELEFTGTVENAIDRLAKKCDEVDAEMRDLDGTLIVAQAPLDELQQMAQEERAFQEKLRELENERRAGLASEVRRQLDEHGEALAEVARLESEAKELQPAARLPANAEVELRDAIARHEEALRNIDDLEARRRDELAKEREAIAREREQLAAFETFAVADADRCIGQAAELRHLDMQEEIIRHQVTELREAMAAKGFEPEKTQLLRRRFNGLPPEAARLLRRQTELNLQFQVESAALEKQRVGATETLRDVDAARAAARTPGWVLLTLGAAALAVGLVILVLRGTPALSGGLIALGALLAAGGGGVIVVGARARQVDRDDALSALAEAQGRINALHRQRGENEAGLGDLARSMGHRDSGDLLRQWDDYARLMEDSGPLMRAQEQLDAAERRRKEVREDAQVWGALAGDGTGDVTPEQLEKVAGDIRRSHGARQRLENLERGFDWVEEQKHGLEEAANAMRSRAVQMLETAGIAYDPSRGWPHHVGELKHRLAGRVRYMMLVEELLPAARRRLQADHEVHQRQRQLEMLLAGGDLPEHARPSADIEVEVKQTRSRLEETQQRRSDLRVEVEEIWRRHTQRRPELEQQRERLQQALERARQFQRSVELAREAIARIATETHRKWAEFLSERVSEILRGFGGRVESLRFGEDLEFSVQLDGGPLVSRGKAHAQLSAGARDQLYLAVRLAISEFLSRGSESLPLLLDDVFATSDDGRLRSGMRALIESFGAGHQVVLATCHRGRMHELRRLDPELYRDRVHWVDLQAGSGARARS
jgi:DNA repair exonuclease SbcCD ATPase subunit